MAITATLRLRIEESGLATGSRVVEPDASVLAAAVDNEQKTDLVIGDNTITVPTGATYLLFIPPTANTQAIKTKGVGGDTGHLLSKTKWTLLTVDGQASIILNAAGAVNGCVLAWY